MTTVAVEANDLRWIEVVPRPPTNSLRGAASAQQRPHPAQRVSRPESTEPRASDSPLATHPRLLPSEGVAGTIAGPVATTPHGHLVVNDGTDLPRDDPREAAAEAQARVQAFAEDALAEDRVRNGRVDPYFAAMHAALESKLDNPDLTLSGNPLRELARAWLPASAQYTRTGNPYAEGAVPEDSNMRIATPDPVNQYELNQRFAAGARLREFADGSYGQGLIALLEVRQGPGGHPVTTALLGSSGNSVFDRYVVDQAPLAVSLLPAPPERAMGVHPDGTHSVWQFEGKIKYFKKLRLHDLRARDFAGLAGMMVLSTATFGYVSPTGRFDEQSGSVEVVDLTDPHFSCQVKLLRLY